MQVGSGLLRESRQGSLLRIGSNRQCVVVTLFIYLNGNSKPHVFISNLFCYSAQAWVALGKNPCFELPRFFCF